MKLRSRRSVFVLLLALGFLYSPSISWANRSGIIPSFNFNPDLQPNQFGDQSPSPRSFKYSLQRVNHTSTSSSVGGNSDWNGNHDNNYGHNDGYTDNDEHHDRDGDYKSEQISFDLNLEGVSAEPSIYSPIHGSMNLTGTITITASTDGDNDKYFDNIFQLDWSFEIRKSGAVRKLSDKSDISWSGETISIPVSTAFDGRDETGDILPDGTYEVVLSAKLTNRESRDYDSHHGESSISNSVNFILDATPPDISVNTIPEPNTAGWNNQDVTVSFICTDDTSGIGDCSPTVLVDQEGANQTITGTATDLAGNSTNLSIELNIDRTPPEISAVLNPPLNPNGCINQTGMVSFSANDPLSGLNTVSDPVSITLQGNQLITGLATDLAGNTTSTSIEVILDNVSPGIVITEPTDSTVVVESPISLAGTVDDPSAIVFVNGIQAVVDSVGNWVISEANLNEGNNLLAAAASDSCGNIGQDQISVLLEAPQTGPELVFCAKIFGEQIPGLPITDCKSENFGISNALVVGQLLDSDVSVFIDGVELPDGVEVTETGDIFYGIREGLLFWAQVTLPGTDGLHPVTALAVNNLSEERTATVSFLTDTVRPVLTLTSPPTGTVINTPTVTVTGTVDDSEAVVSLGSYYSGNFIPVTNGNFEVEIPIVGDGVHLIDIQARDPTGIALGAFTSKRIFITEDTVPPEVVINNPVEGSAVGNPVAVTGTVTDLHPGSVTASVNGGAPLDLSVSTGTYNGILTLAGESNIIEITAVDAAGNSSTVARSVLLDMVPPVVSISSPASGSQVNGTISVIADASDQVSGVARVDFFANGQLQDTIFDPPYSFPLQTAGLPAGTASLTARAFDIVGNSSEATVEVLVSSQLLFEITSPVSGGTVIQSPVPITGILTNNLPEGITEEVGITVNEYAAQFQGGVFGIEGIPLEPGTQTLSATATGETGLLANTSIEVTLLPGNPSRPQVELLASSGSFLVPSEFTFTAETGITNPILSYAIDFEGDGINDFVNATFTTVSHTYAAPGLYFPKLTVVDSSFITYTATTVVNIFDENSLNLLVQNKLNATRDALLNGDIELALTYFIEPVRDRYREIFLQIGPDLSERLTSIETFHLLDATQEMIDAEAVRTVNGTLYSYPISLVKDRDGLWKIKAL